MEKGLGFCGPCVSDGTVIFSISAALTGGSRKTLILAKKHKKPVLHISREAGLASPDRELRRFVEDNGIQVLKVAGPRASKEPDVGAFVKYVLGRSLRAS